MSRLQVNAILKALVSTDKSTMESFTSTIDKSLLIDGKTSKTAARIYNWRVSCISKGITFKATRNPVKDWKDTIKAYKGPAVIAEVILCSADVLLARMVERTECAKLGDFILGQKGGDKGADIDAVVDGTQQKKENIDKIIHFAVKNNDDNHNKIAPDMIDGDILDENNNEIQMDVDSLRNECISNKNGPCLLIGNEAINNNNNNHEYNDQDEDIDDLDIDDQDIDDHTLDEHKEESLMLIHDNTESQGTDPHIHEMCNFAECMDPNTSQRIISHIEQWNESNDLIENDIIYEIFDETAPNLQPKTIESFIQNGYFERNLIEKEENNDIFEIFGEAPPRSHGQSIKELIKREQNDNGMEENEDDDMS